MTWTSGWVGALQEADETTPLTTGNSVTMQARDCRCSNSWSCADGDAVTDEFNSSGSLKKTNRTTEMQHWIALRYIQKNWMWKASFSYISVLNYNIYLLWLNKGNWVFKHCVVCKTWCLTNQIKEKKRLENIDVVLDTQQIPIQSFICQWGRYVMYQSSKYSV